MTHPVDGLIAGFAYSAARRAGYDEGYNDGYNECYREAQGWSQTSYNNGWKEGELVGWTNAINEGNKIINDKNMEIFRLDMEIFRLKSLLFANGIQP